MNLQRLFTRHGPIYIDADQLARKIATGGRILTIYTARGNKLAEVGKTEEIRVKAGWGVHYSNLFASPELAKIDSDRINAEILGRI